MAEQDLPIVFGDWMKLRRKYLDLTQGELAQRAGCSVAALRKIESGDRRPSKQLAHLLAHALDVSSDDREAFLRVARGDLPLRRLGVPEKGLQARFVPTPSPIIARSDNLPTNLPLLVGREPELASLGQLLHDPLCRLITLIGAGGIGKTRLAIEAASRHRPLFSDGVCFVSLAPLTASTFVVPAIAEALGFAFQGQVESRTQLLDYLSARQILLVLDNMEHLLDCTGLLVDILQSASQVKLLVTSRERLNLQSEWVSVIQGLPVPPQDDVASAEEYTSVQLFVQSARRAQVDYTLKDEDRGPIGSICRMVDGMPLGIELAAAWVPALTCGEIAQEIERSLDFLEARSRDMPGRQRSLRAVFDHSWNLLTPEECAILSRLTVFQGGFRRHAAEQIVRATLPTLYALTSKSLVRHEERGRYDMHEVVRQYASLRFSQDPQKALAHDAHSQYYLSLLRDREKDLKGAGQREAIRQLKEEIDNLRAAWAWAIGRKDFWSIGCALRSFGWLCNVGMLYREGVEQIESLVQALNAETQDARQQAVLGTALAQQALLCFRQGQFHQARILYGESLVILRPLGDPGLLTDSLVVSGIIAHLDGEIDRAKVLLEEGLACAQHAGDRPLEAYALFNLGYTDSLIGNYEEGYRQMQTGLAMWREIGDPSAVALGLNHIAPTAIRLGKIQEAETWLQESIHLLSQVGDRWGLGTAYRLLGLTALANGNARQAQTLIRTSLDLFDGYITGWDVAKSLIFLGEATKAVGDTAEAWCSFLQATDVARKAYSPPLMLDAINGMADLRLQEGSTGTALALALFVLSHPAGTHETREYAGRVAAGAETHLSSDQRRVARAWAEDHTLETAVDMLLTSDL